MSNPITGRIPTQGVFVATATSANTPATISKQPIGAPSSSIGTPSAEKKALLAKLGRMLGIISRIANGPTSLISCTILAAFSKIMTFVRATVFSLVSIVPAVVVACKKLFQGSTLREAFKAAFTEKTSPYVMAQKMAAYMGKPLNMMVGCLLSIGVKGYVDPNFIKDVSKKLEQADLAIAELGASISNPLVFCCHAFFIENEKPASV